VILISVNVIGLARTITMVGRAAGRVISLNTGQAAHDEY
jgi:hypothetical protein